MIDQDEHTGPVPQAVYRLRSAASPRQLFAFAALQTALTASLLYFSTLILSLFLGQYYEKSTIDIVLGIYYVSVLFWQGSYVYRVFQMKRPELLDRSTPKDLNIAMATTIVPSREFETLRAKLQAMVEVSACGNRLDLWVLDEEDDQRVKLMIQEFNLRHEQDSITIKHFSRKGIERFNEVASGKRFKTFQARQKGGNINAWLETTKAEAYDLITFLDADHIPKPFYYEEVLPYFKDPELSFLQAPESFSNKSQNFISKAASFERDAFFGVVHRSFFGLGMPVLVGSHTTFRASAFKALGGYYPVHLTEDFLMMMKLRALKLKGVYIDKILAVGELPSDWEAYLGQQMRWGSGGLDLLIRYFPKVWKDYSGKHRLFGFVLLNYYAWGSFFILAKVLLYFLVAGGLSLYLSTPTVTLLVAFTIAAIIGNYYWERQFFMEPQRKSYPVENILMNNFTGALYCLGLFKAIFKPNTPFNVTSKRGAAHGESKRFSYPNIITALLGLEFTGLCIAWYWDFTSAPEAAHTGFDIFMFPLLMSFAINLGLILRYRQLEDTTDQNKIYDTPPLETAPVAVGLTSHYQDKESR